MMADTVHLRNLQAIRGRLVDWRREIAAADAAAIGEGYGAANGPVLVAIQEQIGAVDLAIADETRPLRARP
jgi:hypothetical protein